MKIQIRKIFEWVFTAMGLVTVVFLIAFESKTRESKRCEKLEVSIIDSNEKSFVSKQQVIDKVTKYGRNPLEGKLLSHIDLFEIENEVKAISQIRDCEVYGDLKGNIHIMVRPYEPIARIISRSGKDKYMNKKGDFFALSKYHSARVPLIAGAYCQHKNSLAGDQDLMALLEIIRESPFWKAQITQLNIDRDKNISIIPLLGDQKIFFGKPENLETKLKKLEVFYKKILPNKDWKHFKHIDIQYKNQIVCK